MTEPHIRTPEGVPISNEIRVPFESSLTFVLDGSGWKATVVLTDPLGAQIAINDAKSANKDADDRTYYNAIFEAIKANGVIRMDPEGSQMTFTAIAALSKSLAEWVTDLGKS